MEQDQDIIIEQINHKLSDIVRDLKYIKELVNVLNIPGIIYTFINSHSLNNEEQEKFLKIIELININDLLIELEKLGLTVKF